MLMFPEGTTTNGRALIKFKPGAFLAGVPVQPVLLRYPGEPDTVRWTWKGLTWLGALWHTSSQIYTSVTVEFLPVYAPSQEEKQNPELYAENVQKVMAQALNVPATDYVMEGRFPVKKLGNLSLPLEPPAQETLRLLHEHSNNHHHLNNYTYLNHYDHNYTYQNYNYNYTYHNYTYHYHDYNYTYHNYNYHVYNYTYHNYNYHDYNYTYHNYNYHYHD
ncbi:lysophospholipid acyltransferase LPCAT4-like [Puntigrus tetrazona]|uniref:lysophospholipid acyltransferase LPCAT4-like n=1 Tax=Puntigrus tetrazona TaxID=1606681 RepID=UPI001C8AB89A|nr:lysophospholipid acyltransferase LPCAT4-like [Puntigrus tetrazona]